jgi:thiol-disulfide isomerase/thioredoxin
MFRLFVFILTITSALNGFSSETVIQGAAKGFNGKTIRLTTIKDYITNAEEKLGTAVIQDDQFKFELETDEVIQINLTIEDKSTSFYLAKGKVYNISLSYDEEWNRGKIYDKELSLSFSFPQADDVNQLIKKFNIEYSNFFEQNAVLMANRQASKQIDAFVKKVNSNAIFTQNKFIAAYVKYVCASLEDASFYSKQKLTEVYFKDSPILYGHKEYMLFFTQFYDNHFKKLILGSKGSELLKLLTLENDLKSANNYIQQQLKVNNEAFAELYLLYGIYDIYFDKVFNQKSAMSLLNQISKSGKTKENKQIAINILNKLSYYGTDNVAPAFSLYNQNKDLIQLKQLKGKYIYLNFWASWSLISVKEMQIIKSLHKTFGDKVEFVSINLDDNFEDFKSTHNRFKYNWTSLHYGNQYGVKEDYQVFTIPTYILINPAGKIENNQAENPETIGDYLFRITR